MISRGCKCGVAKKNVVGDTINSNIKIGHEFDVILSYEDVPDYVEDSSIKSCGNELITPCKCNEL